MKPPSKRDAAMLAKGFVSPSIAAEITGLHYTTMCRWMDEGQVDGHYEGARRYLSVESLAGMIPSHADALRTAVRAQQGEQAHG